MEVGVHHLFRACPCPWPVKVAAASQWHAAGREAQVPDEWHALYGVWVVTAGPPGLLCAGQATLERDQRGCAATAERGAVLHC